MSLLRAFPILLFCVITAPFLPTHTAYGKTLIEKLKHKWHDTLQVYVEGPSTAYQASPNVHCAVTQNPDPHGYLKAPGHMAYCTERSRPDLPVPPGGEPLVLFFHGLVMDETSYVGGGYSDALARYRESHPDLPPFRIVAMRTEFESYFSDFRDQHGQPIAGRQYESWLLGPFLAELRQKYPVCSARDCLGTMGYSMGGYGAIKIALRHPETFGLIAASVPALPTLNPFRAPDQSEAQFNQAWNDYWMDAPVTKLFTKPGGLALGWKLIAGVQSVFGTYAYAQQNMPKYLVDTFAERTSVNLPSSFIQYGSEDQLGFARGAEELIDALRAHGGSVEAMRGEGETHLYFKNPKANYEMIRFVAENVHR